MKHSLHDSHRQTVQHDGDGTRRELALVSKIKSGPFLASVVAVAAMTVMHLPSASAQAPAAPPQNPPAPAAAPPAAQPPAAQPPAAQPPANPAPPAEGAPPPADAAPPAEGAPPAQPPADQAPPPPPAAEEPPPPPPEEMAPVEEVPAEEEEEVVKVTLDRREKPIQEYAGSATVLQADDLQRTGINSVKTISNATPFVQIGVQESNTEVFIRGVGSDNNTELGDPAVATHLDGVYIPRPRGIGAMLFDVQRLEVNRGPQGTLRGRNATGGTLNIVTNKPVIGSWDAKASMQFGNYSQKMGDAYVNIPIHETLALRFAAFYENHEPFYKNAGPIHTLKPTEDADVLAYRASLRFVPVKMLKLDVTHDYVQEKGTGHGGTNFAQALQAGLYPDEVPDPRAVIYRGAQASVNSKHWGVAGDLTADFGPVLAEAISSYRYMHYKQQNGGAIGVAFPGMPEPSMNDYDNWSSSVWNQDSRSFVEELRLFSPDKDRLRWTVGGFFFDEKQKAYLGQINDQTSGYAGGEFNMDNMKDSAYAGFADATFDIFKEFRVTGGIRLTHEQKSRTGIGNNYNITNNPNNTTYRVGTEGFQFSQLDRQNYSNTVEGHDPNDPINDGATGAQVYKDGVSRFGVRDTLQSAQIATSGFALQDGKYSKNFVDWRGMVEYDIARDHLTYFSVASGHKSGGFNDNIRTPSGASVAATYNPESLIAFELGSKNEFLDKKLRLNASVFDMEYQDQQFQTVVSVVDPGQPNVAGFMTAVRSNAAQSRIMGLELEAGYQLPAGFLVNVQAQLMDARFRGGAEMRETRVGWGSEDQYMVSIDGNRLPRASVMTANYSLAQNIKTNVGYFDWILSAQTRTKYYMTPFNGEGVDMRGNPNPTLHDSVPTYTRLDASVGFTHPDGKLRLELIGSNLTNVTYMTSLINSPGLNLRFFNPPRMVGVRFTAYL